MEIRKHEEEARKLKENGNNCSVSVYTAFVKDLGLSRRLPCSKKYRG